MSVVWNVRRVDWNEEGLRPKDRVYDTPSHLWLDVEQAKAAARDEAREFLQEISEPGCDLSEWEPEWQEERGEWWAYVRHDIADRELDYQEGCWLRVHPVELV